MIKNNKKKIKLLKVSLFTILCTFIFGVLFLFVIFIITSSYLKGGKFKRLIESKISQNLNIDGEFDEFNWSGVSLNSNTFSAKGYSDNPLSKLRVNGIRANINLGAIKNKTWEVSSVDINQINFLIDESEKKFPNIYKNNVNGFNQNESNWLKKLFFPDKLIVKSFRVNNINFDFNNYPLNILGRGISLNAEESFISNSYKIEAFNGGIWIGEFPKLLLKEGHFRNIGNKIIMDSFDFNLFDESKARVFGEIIVSKSPSLDMECKLSDLPADKILPEDWIKKLKGLINIDININGSIDDPVIQGAAQLTNGSLEALPILDRIDEFLGTSKFRRLALNEFNIKYSVGKSRSVNIDQFYSLSRGTVCFTGNLSYKDKKIEAGKYMIGITPETLNWLTLSKKEILNNVFSFNKKDAFNKVFNESIQNDELKIPPDGFKWAVCQINADSPDPFTNDIRNQIINSGGLALWAELYGLSKVGFEALDLIVETSKEKGIDINALLLSESYSLDSESLKNIAIKLEITDQMNVILDQLTDDVLGLPNKIIKEGGSLLEKFFLGN